MSSWNSLTQKSIVACVAFSLASFAITPMADAKGGGHGGGGGHHGGGGGHHDADHHMKDHHDGDHHDDRKADHHDRSHHDVTNAAAADSQVNKQANGRDDRNPDGNGHFNHWDHDYNYYN